VELYDHPYQPAHLFTLRLWQEELSKGEMEWRLQLRSVESGQTHYFRDWPALISLLLEMVPSADGDQQTTDGGSGGEG